jgi:hypothetical protein
VKHILIGLLTMLMPATASARDFVFEGTWETTNRRLDGTMTCVVTELGNNRWTGHFYGVWEGVDFSYRVKFSGPPDNLRGTCMIDGANYEWNGKMNLKSPGWFKGDFDGTRYRGWFSLKQKAK